MFVAPVNVLFYFFTSDQREGDILGNETRPVLHHPPSLIELQWQVEWFSLPFVVLKMTMLNTVPRKLDMLEETKLIILL